MVSRRIGTSEKGFNDIGGNEILCIVGWSGWDRWRFFFFGNKFCILYFFVFFWAFLPF